MSNSSNVFGSFPLIMHFLSLSRIFLRKSFISSFSLFNVSSLVSVGVDLTSTLIPSISLYASPSTVTVGSATNELPTSASFSEAICASSSFTLSASTSFCKSFFSLSIFCNCSFSFLSCASSLL